MLRAQIGGDAHFEARKEGLAGSRRFPLIPYKRKSLIIGEITYERKYLIKGNPL